MPTSPSLTTEIKVRALRVAALLGRYGSSSVGRILMLVIASLIAGYLVYQSAWLPLRQAAILPAGVSPNNPELATTVLQDINATRIERQQSIRRNFSRYNLLFVPPP